MCKQHIECCIGHHNLCPQRLHSDSLQRLIMDVAGIKKLHTIAPHSSGSAVVHLLAACLHQNTPLRPTDQPARLIVFVVRIYPVPPQHCCNLPQGSLCVVVRSDHSSLLHWLKIKATFWSCFTFDDHIVYTWQNHDEAQLKRCCFMGTVSTPVTISPPILGNCTTLKWF